MKARSPFQKKTKIGYFSQNVGEMSGRSALSEVMSGAKDVVMLGRAMKDMEAAMVDADCPGKNPDYQPHRPAAG